jgi:hypothetical protein
MLRSAWSGLDRRDSYPLSPCAGSIEKAPPGDFGDEATLVGAHCLIHHVFRKLLRLLGRFGHVARPMNTQLGYFAIPQA